MAEALTRLQRVYSLPIFARDNHVLFQNRQERDRLTVEWFQRHRTGER